MISPKTRPIEKQYGWMGVWEAFCVCRRCHLATIFVLEQKSNAHPEIQDMGLAGLQEAANDHVRIHSYINVTNFRKTLPLSTFQTLSRLHFKKERRVWRSVVSMRRRPCFDCPWTSQPRGCSPAKPWRTWTIRPGISGRRLTWLFDNKKLPDALRELSSVVKDEGNTGAHDGTIDEASAEDLIDFTEKLLTHLYTEPEKIRLAQERRKQREAQWTEAKS